MTQRQPRQRIAAHLAFLRTLPCLCCGNPIETEAAHLRFSDARIVKTNAGVGAKADDFFCVPLCGNHHREQHSIGDERAFWRKFGLDPILYSLRLWSVSGNYEMGCQIVEAANANGSARRAAMVVMAG
jgi:hypothetical protein